MILSPGLEKKIKTENLFWQFFIHRNILKMYGKMRDQHFSVLLFSNPWDKGLILVESRGHICPVVFCLFRTLSPELEYTTPLKYWSDILKADFFIAITILLLQNLSSKLANKSLNMLIKWVKMENKFRKWIKSWIFYLEHTNLKMLLKVSEILRRPTTMRRLHLETLIFVRHYSIHPEYVAMYGKLTKHHFNVWLLSNPGSKRIVETTIPEYNVANVFVEQPRLHRVC